MGDGGISLVTRSSCLQELTRPCMHVCMYCIQMFIVQWMDGWMITLIHGLFARKNIFGPVQRTIGQFPIPRAASGSLSDPGFRLSFMPKAQCVPAY